MRNLIFAFPGMGKTPTCKWIPNCMDLDFGMFRNALKVKKEDEISIIPDFCRLINQYVDEEWHVFTNEPKILDFKVLLNTASIVMYLPGQKGLKYCAKKMNVSVQQIEKWVKDWENIAARNHITVVIIDVGLDVYFSAMYHLDNEHVLI